MSKKIPSERAYPHCRWEVDVSGCEKGNEWRHGRRRLQRFVAVEEQRRRGRDARHVAPRLEADRPGGLVVDAVEVEGVVALGREGSGGGQKN